MAAAALSASKDRAAIGFRLVLHLGDSQAFEVDCRRWDQVIWVRSEAEAYLRSMQNALETVRQLRPELAKRPLTAHTKHAVVASLLFGRGSEKLSGKRVGQPWQDLAAECRKWRAPYTVQWSEARRQREPQRYDAVHLGLNRLADVLRQADPGHADQRLLVNLFQVRALRARCREANGSAPSVTEATIFVLHAERFAHPKDIAMALGVPAKLVREVLRKVASTWPFLEKPSFTAQPVLPSGKPAGWDLGQTRMQEVAGEATGGQVVRLKRKAAACLHDVTEMTDMGLRCARLPCRAVVVAS